MCLCRLRSLLSAVGQAEGMGNGGMQITQGPWSVLAGAATSQTITPARSQSAVV